jgi:hypothetical protein
MGLMNCRAKRTRNVNNTIMGHRTMLLNAIIGGNYNNSKLILFILQIHIVATTLYEPMSIQ